MLRRLQVAANLRRAQKTGWKPGYCLNFVHTMLGIPSDGTTTAALEANKIPAKNRYTETKTPPFHPLFIKTQHVEGHVVLTANKRGWRRKRMVWSTDVNGTGTVSKVPLSTVLNWCHGTVLWGTNMIDGKPVK